MKTKIQKAVIEMMKDVSFDKQKHRYTRISDGKYLAGATQICGILKQDWAIPYGAKQAVRYLGYFDEVEGEDHSEDIKSISISLGLIKEMDIDNYLERLRQAKGSIYGDRDKAAELGTEWHEYLEARIKAMMRNEAIPTPPKGNKWAMSAVGSFFKWVDDNVKEFVLSEARVVDLKNEYAGTLDCLAIMKDGSPAIIDFKFANNVSKEWKLQTAAYAKTFEKYGIDIEKRFVFRFPKTEYLNEYNKKKRSYKKIKNEFQIIEYPESEIDWDFEVFLALRKSARWVNSNK